MARDFLSQRAELHVHYLTVGDPTRCLLRPVGRQISQARLLNLLGNLGGLFTLDQTQGGSRRIPTVDDRALDEVRLLLGSGCGEHLSRIKNVDKGLKLGTIGLD